MSLERSSVELPPEFYGSFDAAEVDGPYLEHDFYLESNDSLDDQSALYDSETAEDDSLSFDEDSPSHSSQSPSPSPSASPSPSVASVDSVAALDLPESFRQILERQTDSAPDLSDIFGWDLGDDNDSIGGQLMDEMEAGLRDQNPHIRPRPFLEPPRQDDAFVQGFDQMRQLLRGDLGEQPRAQSRARRSRPDSEPRLFVSDDDDDNSLDDILVDMEIFADNPPRAPRPSARGRRHPAPSGASEVIDLTNEPDSPVQTHARPPLPNPRRQNSQLPRDPPAFSRSDSSILGGPNVIDLTDDSPDPPRSNGAHSGPPNRPGRDVDLIFVNQRPAVGPRLPPPPQTPHNRPSSWSRHPHGSRLRDRGRRSLLDGIRREFANHISLFGLLRHAQGEEDLAGMMGPHAFNPIGEVNLEYNHGAFDQRPPSPKPAHEVPPPARAGFTRDAKEEEAAVCPACGEELAYEPPDSESQASESQPSRTTKTARKRARGEHHFWALKECGHVYCAECFENRRPTNKRRITGFRNDKDMKPICAVDGCDAAVSNKASWVGIYL
ncbi:hypothetical protein SODALDRAFT_324540 [Sodiomyces alkalinus F11]|uniref:Uncharacterized protein n=1 Tax=Sodiomyces alkalinus (strain CBS 110278 / VKM F-3762 / F11) TaxID=1314773 RepID=A0A3N2PUI0_SODAK|nr:hypothetical protein SODALDRAFT_324540 [Sodiomyces alkalinus F11]ROT38114.1 hypothetical protein SODALDRAFT_324540 [Sodiomyces alkalinus F11]